MSDDGKAPNPKEKQPQAPAAKNRAVGEVVQYFGIEPELLRETCDLLSNELPMSKARRIVERLEKLQIFAIPKR